MWAAVRLASLSLLSLSISPNLCLCQCWLCPSPHTCLWMSLSHSSLISCCQPFIPSHSPVLELANHRLTSWWADLLNSVIFQGSLLALGCLTPDSHSRSNQHLSCANTPVLLPWALGCSQGSWNQKGVLTDRQIQPTQSFLSFMENMVGNRSWTLTITVGFKNIYSNCRKSGV